jgi:hypothetical protein
MKKEGSRRKRISGGVGCGGAADYGMYIWGTNQMAGQGNIIQPANNPIGVPADVNTPGKPVSGGRRQKRISGGSDVPISTASPDFTASSMMVNQNAIANMSSQVTNQQLDALTSTTSGTIESDSPATSGGKRANKRTNRRKKKISTNFIQITIKITNGLIV